MKPSVYVYGPAGCGKTTNAKRIAKALGLSQIFDDYHDLLFRKPPYDAAGYDCLILGEDPHPKHLARHVRRMTYADAMAEVRRERQ